jgi:O-antigen ligase
VSSIDTERVVARGDATGAAAVAGVMIALCTAIGLFVGMTTGRCGAWFSLPLLCQWPAGIAVALGVAALPLLVFAVARRPFASFFALYIILVPIDDALLVGQGLTVTKLLGVAVAFTALATIIHRRAQVRVPYAVFGWAALVGLMALSTIWSVDPRASLVDLTTTASEFVLLVIIVAAPIDRYDLRIMINATIASGIVVGIIAMISARQELSTIAGQVGRLYLTFGGATLDPNRFGASLLLPVAMTIGAIGPSRGWQRVALFAILPFPFAAVYLSASRGTMLALIAMAIVAILATRYRIVLGTLLAAVIGLILVVPSEISSRLFSEGTVANGAGRLDIWRVAVEIFRSHWLIGTGIGSFPTAYSRAFFSAYEPQFAGWYRDPHSLLISTSTQLGVIGIALTALALILQFRSVGRIGPSHPYPWLRTTFRAAFIGLFVAAFFVDVLTTKFAWLLFTEMLLAARLAADPLVRP